MLFPLIRQGRGSFYLFDKHSRNVAVNMSFNNFFASLSVASRKNLYEMALDNYYPAMILLIYDSIIQG